MPRLEEISISLSFWPGASSPVMICSLRCWTVLFVTPNISINPFAVLLFIVYCRQYKKIPEVARNEFSKHRKGGKFPNSTESLNILIESNGLV